MIYKNSCATSGPSFACTISAISTFATFGQGRIDECKVSFFLECWNVVQCFVFLEGGWLRHKRTALHNLLTMGNGNAKHSKHFAFSQCVHTICRYHRYICTTFVHTYLPYLRYLGMELCASHIAYVRYVQRFVFLEGGWLRHKRTASTTF